MQLSKTGLPRRLLPGAEGGGALLQRRDRTVWFGMIYQALVFAGEPLKWRHRGGGLITVRHIITSGPLHRRREARLGQEAGVEAQRKHPVRKLGFPLVPIPHKAPRCLAVRQFRGRRGNLGVAMLYNHRPRRSAFSHRRTEGGKCPEEETFW